MSYCGKCGCKLSENDEFCGKCGTPTKVVHMKKSNNLQVHKVKEQKNIEYTPKQPEYIIITPEQALFKKKMLIAFVVCMVCLAMCSIILTLPHNKVTELIMVLGIFVSVSGIFIALYKGNFDEIVKIK